MLCHLLKEEEVKKKEESDSDSDQPPSILPIYHCDISTVLSPNNRSILAELDRKCPRRSLHWKSSNARQVGEKNIFLSDTASD